MKTFSKLLIILVLAGCASRAQVSRLPGETVTNVTSATLRRDVLRTLWLSEHARHAPYPKVVDTRIIEPPKTMIEERGTGLTFAKWTERWVLDRGSSNVTYKIYFDMQGRKGTDLGVMLEDPRLTIGVDVIDLKLPK